MLTLRRLLLLLQRHLSIRKIAKELGLSNTTVMDYRKRIIESGKTLEELLTHGDKELSDLLYPPKETIDDKRLVDFNELREGYLEELARKRATRVILYEEYSKLFPEGFKYSKFCQLLAEAKKASNATIHNNYLPADKLMFDFAGTPLTYVDPDSGELKECIVLIGVLPYSNFCYVEALENATIPHVIKALNNMIEYFGGITVYCKTDNMAQVVQKASRYEPTFTQVLGQWSVHNNTGLLASRVKKPKDKAPVEGHVKIAYNQIYTRLRNTVFHSLRSLNEGIMEHLENLNDRIMQGKDYSRRQRFLDLEQPLLRPLVTPQYVVKHRVERKISYNYHFKIHEDGHQYSVPYKYIGQTLIAIYDTNTIEIYDGLDRILTYRRVYGAGYTTMPEHMPSNHKAYTEQKSMTTELFLDKARKIGAYTEQYIQQLLNASKFEEQAYDSCQGILRLAQKVTIGPVRLEYACKRGLKLDRYSYAAINKILINNQDKAEKELSSQPLQDLPFVHENLRGKDAYK